MSQEEMNKVLDDFEQKLGGDQEPEAINQEIEEPEVEDVNEPDEVEAKAEDEKPAGFMSYDDWVAAGKDPKKYRGEEAFEAHGKTLQELREQKEMLTAVMESMNEWKASQKKQENERVEQAVKEAQKALDQAKEDDDVDAALAAKERLDSLNVNEAPQQQEYNPTIVEFFKKNPIVDSSRPEFDQDFYDDMSACQGAIIDKMTGRIQDRVDALTPRQIQRSLEIAYSQAKELHPDKFRSKRNTRQTPTPAMPQKRQQSAPDRVSMLKGVGKNHLNPRDNEPAMDMYNMLKERNPEAAETFLKRMTGE